MNVSLQWCQFGTLFFYWWLKSQVGRPLCGQGKAGACPDWQGRRSCQRVDCGHGCSVCQRPVQAACAWLSHAAAVCRPRTHVHTSSGRERRNVRLTRSACCACCAGGGALHHRGPEAPHLPHGRHTGGRLCRCVPHVFFVCFCFLFVSTPFCFGSASSLLCVVNVCPLGRPARALLCGWDEESPRVFVP